MLSKIDHHQLLDGRSIPMHHHQLIHAVNYHWIHGFLALKPDIPLLASIARTSIIICGSLSAMINHSWVLFTTVDHYQTLLIMTTINHCWPPTINHYQTLLITLTNYYYILLLIHWLPTINQGSSMPGPLLTTEAPVGPWRTTPAPWAQSPPPSELAEICNRMETAVDLKQIRNNHLLIQLWLDDDWWLDDWLMVTPWFSDGWLMV